MLMVDDLIDVTVSGVCFGSGGTLECPAVCHVFHLPKSCMSCDVSGVA